jgi:membrane protease YdiL (CAAX protease family)
MAIGFVLGFVLVFILLQWSATALGSDRGQAGIVVGLLVVAATLAVERLFYGRPLTRVCQTLGLDVPGREGMLSAGGVSLLILSVIPVYARVSGASVAFYPGWDRLLPGLFAQAGIAEEVLFRGYLFGHLRRGRSLWRAAALATIPFVAVHLYLFQTMAWPVALAALLLSLALSFPLAYLFELGGGTIWAPALLHFVVQRAVKVVVVSGGSPTIFPIVWMAASALLPYLAFLVPRDRREHSI